VEVYIMRLLMAAAVLFSLPLCAALSQADAASPRTISVSPDGHASEAQPGPEQPGTAQSVSKEYYDPDMLTVNGIVTGVDPDAQTMTVNTPMGEKVFQYDVETRFQSGLRAIDTSDVRVGSRIAVLYNEKEGKATLKRIMLVPDKAFAPHATSHHKRHHGKKSSRKKPRKKSTRKKTTGG
jgi:hypothetical protein